MLMLKSPFFIDFIIQCDCILHKNIIDGVENGFSFTAGGGSIHDDDNYNYELVIPGNGVAYKS
jgi:hypothetical protein